MTGTEAGTAIGVLPWLLGPGKWSLWSPGLQEASIHNGVSVLLRPVSLPSGARGILSAASPLCSPSTRAALPGPRVLCLRSGVESAVGELPRVGLAACHPLAMQLATEAEHVGSAPWLATHHRPLAGWDPTGSLGLWVEWRSVSAVCSQTPPRPSQLAQHQRSL